MPLLRPPGLEASWSSCPRHLQAPFFPSSLPLRRRIGAPACLLQSPLQAQTRSLQLWGLAWQAALTWRCSHPLLLPRHRFLPVLQAWAQQDLLVPVPRPSSFLQAVQTAN